MFLSDSGAQDLEIICIRLHQAVASHQRLACELSPNSSSAPSLHPLAAWMLVTHWRWQAGLSCTSGVFARSRTHNARCCLPSHSLLCGSLKPARGPPRERLFFAFLERPVPFSVSGDASGGCLRARAQIEMFSYSCEKWSQLPPRSGVETDGGRQSNSVLPTRLAPPTRRAPPELNRAFAPEARTKTALQSS